MFIPLEKDGSIAIKNYPKVPLNCIIKAVLPSLTS